MHKQKEVHLAHRFAGQMIKIRHDHINSATSHRGRLYKSESLGKRERSHDNPGSTRERGAQALPFYHSPLERTSRGPARITLIPSSGSIPNEIITLHSGPPFKVPSPPNIAVLRTKLLHLNSWGNALKPCPDQSHPIFSPMFLQLECFS